MFHNLIKLVLDYSVCIIPTFLFAILISAILSETLPEKFFENVLGSKGVVFVLFSSIIGALIPLCTCGMIPLASKLQKKGTSWLIVISFLTAGNASSITALFMTMVLGWKITLLRFFFSVIFGIIVAYCFVLFFKPTNKLSNNSVNDLHTAGVLHAKSLLQKIITEFFGLIFSFGPWVLVAIFTGVIISLYIKPNDIAMYAGSENLASSFLLAVSGFPFYFCAGADIPIAKALIEKGACLGSVLAFMTASPGVNLTSFLVYQKWLGFKSATIYIILSALVCGVLGFIVNMILK